MRKLHTLILLVALSLGLLGCKPPSTQPSDLEPLHQPRVEAPNTVLDPNPAIYTNQTITIAYWNIEWFPAGPASSPSPTAITNHLNAVTKVINQLNPTILVLCEVRDERSAKMLNQHLKEPYPYLAVTDFLNDNQNRENDANRQELVMLSRIPWQEVWEIDFGALPASPTKPARGFLGSAFTLHDTQVTIYGGHWKSNFVRPGAEGAEKTALKNVEKRELASRYLLQDINRHGLKPMQNAIVVGGDFNTDVWAERFKGDHTIRMLLQAGFWSSLEELPKSRRWTIAASGRYPATTFDYVLTSAGMGQRKAKIVDVGNTGEPGDVGHASDHRMVVVEY